MSSTGLLLIAVLLCIGYMSYAHHRISQLEHSLRITDTMLHIYIADPEKVTASYHTIAKSKQTN